MEKCLEILRNNWGYAKFHSDQEQVISEVIKGRDALALLPTGAGKSLCYQIPAMRLSGLCIVISPLIALMFDQVERLKKLGIKAQVINSSQSKRENELVLDNATNDPNQKFLYIAPERIDSFEFRERFKSMKISLIAVDEAHCISQWGFDFRPAYLGIARLRELRPDVPLVALTATATTRVVDDILFNLNIRSKKLIRSPFDRPNLHLSILPEKNKRNRLLELIKLEEGSGIIYCQTRKQTVELTLFLQQNKISSDFYHAGLENSARTAKQIAWIQNKTKVICATNAFGMGIDKADVRFVIHYDIPENIESYYQESGRAGRDGKVAKAILIYEETDLALLTEKLGLKFPPTATLKDIYIKLCSHAQIAVGTGKDDVKPFVIGKFCHSSKLSAALVYNAIKVLESLGFLQLIDRTRRQSTIKLLCESSILLEHFKNNQRDGSIVQTILRTHIGAFDDFVELNEHIVAEKSSCSVRDVQNALEKLSAIKLVSYHGSSFETQMIFLQERQPDNYFSINQREYLKRKTIAVEKMEKMKYFLEKSKHNINNKATLSS